MKACEELSNIYGIENCPECHCSTGDDTEYKDFSNKYIMVCAQCGHEWDTRDLDENKEFRRAERAEAEQASHRLHSPNP